MAVLDFHANWGLFYAEFEGIGCFDGPISHLASHYAFCLLSFHVPLCSELTMLVYVFTDCTINYASMPIKIL